MSEIEKAIKKAIDELLLYRSDEFKLSISMDTNIMAVEALQEKLERDKGCEYCEGLTTGEDFIKCPSLNFKMDVNCCTMCGRKLVE